ncbi:DUF559 domain-containing protein [Pseudoxanthomonas suwonensis]
MRSGQTEAELKLWSYLRAGRFDGLKFRRQHPVPPPSPTSAAWRSGW